MTIENEDGTTVDDQVAIDAAAAADVAAAAAATEPSALDVISAAIDDAAKPRAIVPKQDELDQEDTRPRNADGTFKAETAEEIATREAADAAAIALKNETPEAKATREAAEAAAGKKEPDAVNDPIPEGLNKRTADRMKALIGTVKQQEAIVESHTQLFDIVRDAGSPQEFSAMIGYMKSSKSNDPKVLETAYSMLQSELKGLAIRMGKPLYEVNLLRDPANKDLVDKIAAGTLDNGSAHELALVREANKQRQGKTSEEAATTAEEKIEATARNDMDVLEKALLKRDGVAVYKAKRDILESTLQVTMESVSPAKWTAIFTKAYDGLKVAAPAAAAVVPPVEKQQPLRTKQPAGASGAATAPKSALEAMNAALGQ